MDVRKATDELASKAEEANKADEALKFSQAALNLAHVSQVLKQIKQT